MNADPLAAWKMARNQATSRLVQVIIEGDSTFAGQTLAEGNYSPVTRIRQRLQDAGIPDGGHGVVNGQLDTASVSLEPADAGVITEPSYNITNGQNLQANYVGSTTVVGAFYQAAVYGTRIRVSYALYNTPTVLDITVDGVTERITVPVATITGGAGTADGNWQAGGRWLKTGLAYGRHVVTVTLVSGRMSVLIEGTRDTGIVLHNFAARGAQAIHVPWHQFQDWAGLQVTAAPPVVPATRDTSPGSHAPSLGIYAKGINDQQGNGGTDTSAAYGAKAADFARAMIAGGASAIICGPWFESANQAQLAPAYRAAAKQAAEDTGALFVDLSTKPGGALAAHTTEAIGGANANPHLTALAYRYQGDFLADLLLAPAQSRVGSIRSGSQVRSIRAIRYGTKTRTGTWR